MTDLTTVRTILDQLIAFDTTSRKSNLALIEWVEAYLAQHGVMGERVSDATGAKANLFASCGPDIAGGVILSGHRSLVPETQVSGFCGGGPKLLRKTKRVERNLDRDLRFGGPAAFVIKKV